MGGKKYLKIWWLMTLVSSRVAFVSRFGAIIFIIGKILRFASFLFFLFILSSEVKIIQGYTLWQMIFFFATFNLVDTLAQFFLREVYRFRYYVVSGNFDYILIKPLSPLFRSLFGGSDVLDLSMVLLTTIFLIYSGEKIGNILIGNILLYSLLVLNAFLIAIAFHIFVLATGVLTTTVDNAILLYRDFTQMGRVPVDIYHEPLRSLLTFALPVGIMMTFPAKAFLGLLSTEVIILSFLIGIILLFLSIKFWRFSLAHYTSVG